MQDCKFYRGQGATEYLVLLAVVLIVALVSVALLGFFPGMASDAQITQSQMYWRSASPISIVDNTGAYVRYSDPDYYYGIYLRFRNNGQYPIRLSKIIGNGGYIDKFYSVSTGSDQYFNTIYLAPGGETCINTNVGPPASCIGWIDIYAGSAPSGRRDFRLDSTWLCNSQGAGTFRINDLGFEYTEYIEGQQITKKQYGKPFVAKCTGLI